MADALYGSVARENRHVEHHEFVPLAFIIDLRTRARTRISSPSFADPNFADFAGDMHPWPQLVILDEDFVRQP